VVNIRILNLRMKKQNCKEVKQMKVKGYLRKVPGKSKKVRVKGYSRKK